MARATGLEWTLRGARLARTMQRMSLLGDVPRAWMMAEAPAAMPDVEIAPPRMLLCIGPTLSPQELLADSEGPARWRGVQLHDPAQAVHAMRQIAFDALLLEHEALAPTPALLLSRLRSQTQRPLIVLTRRADEIDEVVALEHGADRVLIRPISPRRLRAHLQSAWQARSMVAARRPDPGASDGDIPEPVAGWHLDPGRRRLLRGAERIELSNALFALAARLMRQAGSVVAASELLGALRAIGAAPDPGHVPVYVHRLRRRLAGSGLRVDALRGSGFVLLPAGAV